MEEKIINEKIRDKKLLVIDENGNKLGILLREEALKLASSKELDLVLFAKATKPDTFSVAKIIDFGKFTYQQKIKAKESKKKQTIIKEKEVKVRPQIGLNDLKWRAKNTLEWLNDGFQVKFKIQTFGRVRFKDDLIEQVYQNFLGLLDNKAKVITPLKKLSPVMYECTLGKNS